jgi:predicted O-methyltransferase YrrM
MSERATTVTAEHFAYLAARTRGEDAFLRELKEAARAAGIPAIWIAPEQANLLQILLKAIGARSVLEVGTLAGYSAIAMARALPEGGRLTTIEIEPKHAEFAERWAACSDVAGKVRVLRGSGQSILPGLPGWSFDAAFLDADKSGYPFYLRECLRLVRRGGLVMVDNAFAFGELFAAEPRDRETAAVRAFNDLVPTVAGLHAVIVPLGDGMWVGVVE